MAIYDSYAMRSRVGAGVAIKRRQASLIFSLGMRLSRAETGGVLEVGPGDGYVAELALSQSIAYTCIEGSDAVAKELEMNGVQVFRGYVPPLPTGMDGGFKACFMLHVLEHMKSAAEASQVIGEIREKLLPGGTIIIACPDYSRWGYHFYDCDYTHAYPVTRRRLAQLLKDQGLEVVHHTVYVGPLFGYFSIPVSWVAKLLFWPFLDDFLRPILKSDVLNRGLLTFLPNILTIARRPLSGVGS